MKIIPGKFKFSSEKKHRDIALSEDNMRAKYPSSFGTARLVVVEPAVSNSNPCRILFKINSLSGAYVGLCIPNIVAANGYEMKGSFIVMQTGNNTAAS